VSVRRFYTNSFETTTKLSLVDRHRHMLGECLVHVVELTECCVGILLSWNGKPLWTNVDKGIA
jgi:hypothetical protein